MSSLDETIFACIDCETTGLDKAKDRVLEVACALFRGEEVIEEFQTLVNPKCEIPHDSFKIHKISKEMVKESPTIDVVLPRIFAVVGSYPIIGHGIGFDVEILVNEAKRHNITTTLDKNTLVDTLRLGRLYGESPTNSLDMLRSHFNIPEEGAHRAMNDVMVNIKVFRHLVQKYKTYSQVLDALSRPILMKAFPLGKYKGRLFKDLPLDYLYWCLRQDFDMDLMYSVNHELKKRKKGNLFSQVANPFQSL